MSDALDRLRAFVGEWETTATFAPDRGVPELHGRTVFEWALGGAFLLQRSAIEHPVPDSISIIGVNPDGATYTQHYFDERGVARLCGMTFDGARWTLTREQEDFTPLEFAQRFRGTFEVDHSVIRGQWEIRFPGKDWEKDFELTYVRVGS